MSGEMMACLVAAIIACGGVLPPRVPNIPRPPTPPLPGWAVVLSVPGGAGLTLYAVDRFNDGRTWLGTTLAVVGLAFAVLNTIDYLERREFPRLTRVVSSMMVVVFALGFYASWDVRRDEDRQARERTRLDVIAREESAALAAAIRQTQTAWFPGAGVVEAQTGAAIGWVAVQPTIPVDLDAERDIPAASARRIPLRVVLLNNDFRDLTFDGREPLWRLDISAVPNGLIIAQWDASEEADPAFGPAERRDFTIMWDGLDEQGRLLGPGRYAALLTTAAVGNSGLRIAAQTVFEIRDAGPEIVGAPPPSVDTFAAGRKSLEQGALLSELIARALESQQFELRMRSPGRP